MNPKPGDIVAYKVRDPKTGLYQMGGSGRYQFAPNGSRTVVASWSKMGKTWNSMGHLKAHFTVLRQSAGYRSYLAKRSQGQPAGFIDPIDPDWEIVELTVSTSTTGAYRCGDIIDEVK